MVLNRQGRSVAHRRFHELAEYLRPGDVLALNVTRVFPARLRGLKRTGGKVETLLLEGMGNTLWKALIRGTSKPSDLVFPENLTATMVERLDDGEWVLNFSRNSIRSYLKRHGEMPLPPYIRRREKMLSDGEDYQTVFARREGSIAAPTAGFHFTDELLRNLRAQGVFIVDIVLHVGWGTFRPVRAEQIERHAMLPEAYEISDQAALALTAARREGRRIIAVGTTSARALESVYDQTRRSFRAGKGRTNLFIYPGYRFIAIDALITNFHLPHSTPLLLACAFYSDRTARPPHPTPSLSRGEGGGRGEPPFSLKAVYEMAIREEYRFYSYGDAMLIQ